MLKCPDVLLFIAASLISGGLIVTSLCEKGLWFNAFDLVSTVLIIAFLVIWVVAFNQKK